MSNMPKIKADLRAHWEERRRVTAEQLAEAQEQAKTLRDAGLGDAADIYVQGLATHLANIDKALAKLV
ncbi:hypothetical protein [Methylobacterium sp. MA0201]|uniref:hypothetical protein n=1 Tax=Methylobacterium alsaeris TaxID=3344826 RepID=UPI0037573998